MRPGTTSTGGTPNCSCRCAALRVSRTSVAARSGSITLLSLLAALAASAACTQPPPTDRVRVSGQVEATEVQVASQVAGRLLERKVAEGTRVDKGAVVAVLDTADTALAINRAKAERAQAEAQAG